MEMTPASKRSPGTSPVRFRLRTLLWITTVIAVLASIGGPYYRAQGPPAQKALLVYWGIGSVATLAMVAIQWRRVISIPRRLGDIRVNSFRASQHGRARIFQKLAILPAFAFVAVHSFDAVRDAKRAEAANPPQGIELIPLAGRGLLCGCLLGSMTMLIVRMPVAICENGIALPQKPTKWEQVRSVSWLKNAEDIVKIVYAPMPLRLEEAFLYVPPEEREAAEAIFAEKMGAGSSPSPTNI
jgi:hypothetical protein